MATARVNNDGDKVVLKLTFWEAAAIHAILCRVSEETDEAINDATHSAFSALDEVRTEDLYEDWPTEFEDFAGSWTALIDPDKQA